VSGAGVSADVAVPAERVVRFALIGCGDIGAHNAKALDEAPNARLTTIFDPMSDLALDLAGRHAATAVDSLAAAITSPDVDAVLIATPHDTHEAVVRASLEAGRHVLLEKPLAADLDAAVRIARMAEESANFVAVLFPMRRDPRFLRALEAIETSPEGRPCGAAATYLIRKPPHYFTAGFSKRAPSTWRQSKTRAGGGVVIMNVLHHLDVVRALIGSEAETVFARTAPSSDYPGIEDVASLIVDFGGALATFVGAGSAFDGPGERIELWSPSLRITLLPEGIVADANGERSEDADPEPPHRNRSRVDFIAEFARSVLNGTQPAVTVQDALAVQAIVSTAYVSAAEGRSVRVADVLRDAGGAMRTASVMRSPDGFLRVSGTAHSPAAVFVDSSPRDGGLWARAYPRSPGVDRAAAREFVASARRAVAIVEGVSDGQVEVIGEGLLARLVERLLPAAPGPGSPLAVIEATGSPANVRRAISSVQPLGTVVLAAPLDARVVQIAGYAEVHLRGLTVVGLPWATDPAQPPAELVDWALACLARAGEGVPAPAPWYRCDP
jgi:predicted dehydrogenase